MAAAGTPRSTFARGQTDVGVNAEAAEPARNVGPLDFWDKVLDLWAMRQPVLHNLLVLNSHIKLNLLKFIHRYLKCLHWRNLPLRDWIEQMLLFAVHFQKVPEMITLGQEGGHSCNLTKRSHN